MTHSMGGIVSHKHDFRFSFGIVGGMDFDVVEFTLDEGFGDLNDAAGLAADVLNVTLQINRAALHLNNRVKYFSNAYQAVSDDILVTLPEGSIRP
ncbi:hypothetical protein [Achromobacter sp. ESBL13]|uniref:hypothetical protein n=1 Tax=Achromobacter sp. ESBL13 TaxID=3077328 RepID=UPI002FC7646B